MDLGKEISIPLRILSGEIPIKDFDLNYPPFPYYFNAGFLYFFGKNYNNFFILGAIQSLIYLFLAWKLLAKINTNNWQKGLMLLIFITCALFPGENDGRFFFPYTFNWSYNLIFSVTVLLLVGAYLEKRKKINLFFAGIFTGFTILSKQDYLLCALLAILFGMLYDWYHESKGKKISLFYRLGIILVGSIIPIALFNGFLVYSGVRPSQLIENWFMSSEQLELLRRLPAWEWYLPFNKRFLIFGIILVSGFLSSYFWNNRYKSIAYFFLLGTIVLSIRQSLKDSIQMDFKTWATIFSLLFGIIHLVKIRPGLEYKNYWVPLFAISALGIQLRPIFHHAVVNLQFSGNFNIYLLFGALLFLIYIGELVNGFINKKVYLNILSVIFICVIISSTYHLVAYYNENRWKKINTSIGAIYLPNTYLDAVVFQEVLQWLKELPKDTHLLALGGDLVLSAAGRISSISDFQSAYLATPQREKKIIEQLKEENIEYVLAFQDGNYYLQVLGFLYGIDLNQYLKENYYTVKVWGGNVPFEKFQIFKNKEPMIYILKRFPK